MVGHRGCGMELTGELACDRCGHRLSGAEVDVTVGDYRGGSSWNPLRGSPSDSLT